VVVFVDRIPDPGHAIFQNGLHRAGRNDLLGRRTWLGFAQTQMLKNFTNDRWVLEERKIETMAGKRQEKFPAAVCVFAMDTSESVAQVVAIEESIRRFSYDRAPDAMACTMNRLNTIQQMLESVGRSICQFFMAPIPILFQGDNLDLECGGSTPLFAGPPRRPGPREPRLAAQSGAEAPHSIKTPAWHHAPMTCSGNAVGIIPVRRSWKDCDVFIFE